jgi:uncharacterized protein YndB with AHSA1/START domain
MPEARITVVPNQPLVSIARELDAPLDLVVRAFLDPELVAQWFGPRGVEIVIERYEVRDGGR